MASQKILGRNELIKKKNSICKGHNWGKPGLFQPNSHEKVYEQQAQFAPLLKRSNRIQ